LLETGNDGHAGVWSLGWWSRGTELVTVKRKNFDGGDDDDDDDIQKIPEPHTGKARNKGTA